MIPPRKPIMKKPFRFPTMPLAVLAGCLLLGGFFVVMSEGKKESPKAYPKTVLLIRHAEEPPDSEMSSHLSEAGKRRAEAIVHLFEKSEARTEPFPKPDFLFAPKPSGKSRRSLETLEPLGKQLNLPIAADREKEDADKLAYAILHDSQYAGKTVLIAWNHSVLPDLARAFQTADVPANWKNSQFDRVWEITFDQSGKAAFRDRAQALMPGDKPK